MSQHAYAHGLTICQEEGTTLEAAENIMRRLIDAGWHWRPPDTFHPVPDTGEKAQPEPGLLEKTRARIADAQAALKRAENEHFDQIREQVKG